MVVFRWPPAVAAVEYQNACYATLTCTTNERQQGNECVCDAGDEKVNGVCFNDAARQRNISSFFAVFSRVCTEVDGE